MRRILYSIAVLLLNVLVIYVLVIMARNRDEGKPTNVMETAGQATRKAMQDFKSGWQSADQDTLK
jgi:hypothetical protein